MASPVTPDEGLVQAYEHLVADAPFGVLTIDTDSTIRYANSAVTDLLGYDSEALAGAPLETIIPDRLRDSHTEAFEAYLETGERHLDWNNVELPALHRDGHEVRVSIAFRETPTDDETLFTGVFTDLSGGHRLRGAPQETIGTLHELYVIASDATLSFEQRRESILDLGCRYLDLEYGFVTEITSDEQVIVASVGDHDLLQPGERCPIEESYCRETISEDGFLAIADAAAEGFEDDPAYERFGLGSYIGGKLLVDGELFGTLCFASTASRDRTFTDGERTFVELASRWLGYELQQRHVQQQLERQNDRLEEFASHASHDLRNPLSAAAGRLELAIEQYGDDEDLLAVKRSLEDADARIDEMLEFARAGDAVTDPKPVSLSEAAAAAWETLDTEGATLAVDDEVRLRGDRDRIERLFENLFRNAVEHAGEDATVRLGALPTPGFYVADDGPGIPAGDRETVFESGFTTDAGGSGYGLSIVEEIATAHGWSVEACGDGDGARFEFTVTDHP